MMQKPTRLSSGVFLELPPVLAQYMESTRNLWLEGNPGSGRVTLLGRQGTFGDLESHAVQRKQLVEVLGIERARGLCYRVGFEQGRRDALRHVGDFGRNVRLALQAGPVFRQLQGYGRIESVRFEFDLDARTLHREVVVRSSVESLAHRGAMLGAQTACWAMAGYLAGHASEALGRRVLTLETACTAQGDEVCRFISRLDQEWGEEGAWPRTALAMRDVDTERADLKHQLAEAQTRARRLQGRLTDLQRKMRSDLLAESIVAGSDAMAPVMRGVRRAAGSDAAVLIRGEQGVGKETIARAIHYGSQRKSKPFVEFDSAGMTPSLQLQEMQGFARGAFPGAMRDYDGACVRSSGGTLYVTELRGLSMEAQRCLLRAMESGSVVRLGSGQPVKCDPRVIAATSADLREAVSAGELSEELCYAFRVIQVSLPPLRARGVDIFRLAEDMLTEFAERYGKPGLTMAAPFKEALLHCAWPGNVRQLRNVMEHSVIMASGVTLEADTLPGEVLSERNRGAPRALTPEVVRAALEKTGGNRSEAARLLSIGRTTLWRLIKEEQSDR